MLVREPLQLLGREQRFERSEDARQGSLVFKEKRTPKLTGR